MKERKLFNLRGSESRHWQHIKWLNRPTAVSLYPVGLNSADSRRPFVKISTMAAPRHGQPATLVCTLENAGAGTKILQQRWYHRDLTPLVGTRASGVFNLGRVLHFRRVNLTELSEPVVYTCQIIFRENGLVQSLSAKVQLNAWTSNVLDIHSSSSTVHHGGSVHLLCQTASNARATWKTSPTAGKPVEDVRNSTNRTVGLMGELWLRNVTDNVSYQCCALPVPGRPGDSPDCRQYDVIVSGKSEAMEWATVRLSVKRKRHRPFVGCTLCRTAARPNWPECSLGNSAASSNFIYGSQLFHNCTRAEPFIYPNPHPRGTS